MTRKTTRATVARKVTEDERRGFMAKLRVDVDLERLAVSDDRTVAVAAEAIRVARNRGDAEGLAEIERACRAVLDRAWKPKALRLPHGGDVPALVPTKLRAAEAHRLLAHVAAEACAAAAVWLRDEAGDASDAVGRLDVLMSTLATYPEHFPRGAAATIEAVGAAVVRCADRGHEPIGPVLRAWGATEATVKHAQKTTRRGQKR